MAVDALGNTFTSNQSTSSNWVWSAGVSSGASAPAAVLRYSPSYTGVSNGWMVFDGTGMQRIAR